MANESNKKGIIAVGLTIVTLGLAYYFFVYKKNNQKSSLVLDNFTELKNNLGANIKETNGVVIVSFNTGKNKAQFYTNSRLAILDGSGKVMGKGSYSDGGKTISMDNGKSTTSGSVWGNLTDILK